MKLTKRTVYIGLFSILYLIVAFSSFFHAVSFFQLANNSWMSIILAFAFEIGQAAVLFSLLTSAKDRSRVMPWALMTMFTLVQVIGNVFSSYKYLITNSSADLRFFKEPIFIWTDLPDDQATVIIVYLVGALLPIASLLLTSMITNYLNDEEELKQLENNTEEKQIEETEIGKIDNEIGPKEPIILNSEEDFDKVYKEETEETPIEEKPIEETKEVIKETPIEESKEEIKETPIEESKEEIKEQEKPKSHFINL